jgi:hypothetical protein
MILESFLVLGVIGIILIFFYKQAVKEFRILQTDSFEKAMSLLFERSPIVVLPFTQPPQLWTRADIKQRPTLQNFAVNGSTLTTAIEKESFPLAPISAERVATEVGLPIWIKQNILTYYQQTSWWTSILTTRTEALIGAQGLRQTYAYSTILFVTEGAIAVSLLNETSEAYLPTQWAGKRISKLTRDEAPLLQQIQYIDVIVRPGSCLIIPPHWKVCWETYKDTKPALAVWTEIHHPLSKLAFSVAHRK